MDITGIEVSGTVYELNDETARENAQTATQTAESANETAESASATASDAGEVANILANVFSKTYFIGNRVINGTSISLDISKVFANSTISDTEKQAIATFFQEKGFVMQVLFAFPFYTNVASWRCDFVIEYDSSLGKWVKRDSDNEMSGAYNFYLAEIGATMGSDDVAPGFPGTITIGCDSASNIRADVTVSFTQKHLV